MQIDKHDLLVGIRDYIMITLGILSYSFGFCAFIFPEKVVIGGLAGIGTLTYFVSERYLGWGIPVAITQYVCNLLLLAIAYKVVGRRFVIRTIFGATLISLGVGVLQPFFPEPLIQGQPFMSVVLGGILCGIGLGVVFVHNGSTGGTDIVAAMVSKKSNVTVGRTMIYCDFCIISSSYLLFHSIDRVVFGLIVLFFASYLTDFLINTNRQAVQFTIFSQKWREIADAINNEAHRGCTVFNGMGWFSKGEVHMLMVMCRKIESVTIFRIIKSIDPNSFVTQCNVSGVYGKGFDQIKTRMPKGQKANAQAKADAVITEASDNASQQEADIANQQVVNG